MKHNKLLTLSLLASFLILISASFAYAQNAVTFGTVNVCPQHAGSKVYLTVSVDNDVDIAALDIVGQTVTVSGGVALTVTDLTFGNRMADVNVLDQRYALSLLGSDVFRFGAVKVAGDDLGTGNGQIATLELEFVSDCQLGSAAVDPGTGNCNGNDVATAFVDADANAIAPTFNSGAVNVVNAPVTITSCPDDFVIYWNGGVVNATVEADDPDLACGCDALTFSVVDGPGSINASGVYTYNGDADDIGCNTVVIEVADEYGSTATCSFDIDVLNMAPEFTGINYVTDDVDDMIDCGDTIFTVWDEVLTLTAVAEDPDSGPASLTYSLLSWSGSGNAPTIDQSTGVITWEIGLFESSTGDHAFTVVVHDGAPLDECNTANADTCTFFVRVYGFWLSIEKVHDAYQGHNTEVSVYIDSMLMGTGMSSYYNDNLAGYDILLAYDASALTFISAEKGQLLVDFGWEYFTYRFGPNGNCGNACPSGMVRIVGLAETNNGANHPGDTDEPGELAKLTFFVSNDRTLECQYAPISFYWFDCGDNALSDVTGRFLFVGDSVFHFEGSPYTWDDTLIYGYDGAEAQCWDTVVINAEPGFVKNYPLRAIAFRNGGVDIICADSIDAPGDINLNGIPNEIADAVMYTNYFIKGLTAFDSPEASIAASDVNKDGIVLSVADLVYQIRIITGDANPFPKAVAGEDALNISTQMTNEVMNVNYNASADVGATVLSFAFTGEIGTPMVNVDGMDMEYGINGNELKVIIYSFSTNSIAQGTGSLLTIPVNGELELTGAEAATYDGVDMSVTTKVLPTMFQLVQNYPNPFNPTTTIELAIPVATDYSVIVYNIAGQVIRSYNGFAEAGIVSLVWDGKDASGSTVASGMYFYKATAGSFTATKKMILMK
jgi:hypothetical protein